MGAASLAIFLDLDAIRIIAFVLHRRVIAAFALAASERDDDSVVLLGHCYVLGWAACKAPRGQLSLAFLSILMERKEGKKNCPPVGGRRSVYLTARNTVNKAAPGRLLKLRRKCGFQSIKCLNSFLYVLRSFETIMIMCDARLAARDEDSNRLLICEPGKYNYAQDSYQS